MKLLKLFAVMKAQRLAKEQGRPIFVVYESGGYDTATEYDLDTYYLGAQVVYCAEPETRESNER